MRITKENRKKIRKDVWKQTAKLRELNDEPDIRTFIAERTNISLLEIARTIEDLTDVEL